MQIQTLNRITEIAGAANRPQKPTPFLQLAAARAQCRPLRIMLPLRRGESCLTKRAMLAAIREAELAEWMASGGDYLNSMHQRVH